MLELVLGLLSGVLVGTLTGLTPGLHINQAALVAVTLPFSPLFLASFLVAMALTHSLLDFIPSIFFGAPSEMSVAALLPGHELLLKGRGYEAVFLSMSGALIAAILMAIATPHLLLVVPHIYERTRPFIGGILAAIVIHQLLRSPRVSTLLILPAACALGILLFSLPNTEPLLPLLTGLFGVSTLILSMNEYVALPIQNLTRPTTNYAHALSGCAATILLTIFPALGPAQAATMVKDFVPMSKHSYLIATGAIGTASMIMGLITLITIEKARNGVFISLHEIPHWHLLAVSLSATAIAFLMGNYLAKIIATNIWRIDYQKLNAAVILFVVIIVALLNGLTGVIILTTATCLGILTQRYNVPRHYLMSSIIAPVVLYYV